MDVEKEKRKGLPQTHNPWIYAAGGFAAGAMFTAIGVYIFDATSKGIGISGGSFTFISMVFAFSILFLFILGLFIVGRGQSSSIQPMLRENPDKPGVVQEMINNQWVDRLTVSSVAIKAATPSIDAEKDKTPPRRPSLFWMAMAALLSTLYGLFLSRPSQEKQ